MDQFARSEAADLVQRTEDYVIKVRHRAQPPRPWKWEIYAGLHLVTASSESFASQGEAHDAAHEALNRLISQIENRDR